MMRSRSIRSKLVISAACLLAAWWTVATPAGSEPDPHAYFKTLLARGDLWKAYSFRPQAGEPVSSPYYEHQLDRPNLGGYANDNDQFIGTWVTYDPASDSDPHRQDAAKVVIPAFIQLASWAVLQTPISATDTVVTLGADATSTYDTRAVKLGSEVCNVVSRSGRTITIQRGQFGTTAQAHPAGTGVEISLNSLANQVRVPLGTTDGHHYLFVWDAYWTDSYLRMGTNHHKSFQFSSGKDTIWLEPRARYDGGTVQAPGFNPQTDVGAVDVRSYNPECNTAGGDCVGGWSNTDGNHLGPGPTRKDPLSPMAGTFIIRPNIWTRWFIHIEQRANDYDYMDMWVADETHNAVQIYSRMPLSVRPQTNQIERFWIEFNSSQPRYVRGDLRSWVSYTRNFVALKDAPADLSPLLLRPLAGVPPPYTGPAPSVRPLPPTNLRIIK